MQVLSPHLFAVWLYWNFVSLYNDANTCHFISLLRLRKGFKSNLILIFQETSTRLVLSQIYKYETYLWKSNYVFFEVRIQPNPRPHLQLFIRNGGGHRYGLGRGYKSLKITKCYVNKFFLHWWIIIFYAEHLAFPKLCLTIKLIESKG